MEFHPHLSVENVDNVERWNCVYIMGNLKNGDFLGKIMYYRDEKSRIMSIDLYTYKSTQKRG